MKNRMLLLLAAAILCCMAGMAKSPTLDKLPNFTIEGVGSTAGSNILSVSIIDKKAANVKTDDLLYAAVYGVLFNGFAYSDGTLSMSALCGDVDALTEHREFFDDFFAQGKYRNFASLVPESRRVAKYGKKEYIVTDKVKVDVEGLRSYLTKHEIIKGLNTGW